MAAVNEVMRWFKYLMGLWTGIAVYSLISLLGGPSGLFAYRQLASERERQWDTLRELGVISEDLENTRNGLLYDHDLIAVHARRLGYARANERFIRVVGLGVTANPHTTEGQVYFAREPKTVSDTNIKIAALVAGLAAFALFLALELLRR